MSASNILDLLSTIIEPALAAIPTTTGFESAYPHIARWVVHYGWIELGPSDPYRSMLRAFDHKGLVWESEEKVASLHKALRSLDRHLEHWINTYYGAQT